MLLGQLITQIVREGETFEEALDREARTMVVESRAETLLPLLHHLITLDLSDLPFAQLLVALVANADVPKRTQLTFAMLDEATATFSARPDADGEAIAAWVRGNVLLGLGDVAGAARAWKRAADLDPTTDLVEDMSLANLAYASYGVSGNVDEALHLAAAAVGSARARDHGRGEGLALVYTAYLQIMSGRFAQAEEALATAAEAFGRANQDDGPPYEWPLVYAGIGALAGLRGLPEQADTEFLRGVLLARHLENPWYEAIVRTLRADHTMHFDSRRAHVDCRWALHEFEDVTDRWWGTIVLRVRADAALAAGEVEASRQLALGALERLENPVERGRCLVSLSRALLASDDQNGAAQRADEAVRSLEPTGASFLLCEALLLLADCDPLRAPDAIERARELSTDDTAYARLWAARPNLRTQVLGRAVVCVGSVPVRFRTTRAELLVLMLTVAGGRAIDAGQVAAALWPEGAGTKVASNLSTATYDARQALGSEAWRLHRRGSQLWLDLDGAFVDLDDAMRRARGSAGNGTTTPSDDEIEQDRRAALRALHEELLPALAFEPWVAEANRRREAFLELMTGDPG